MDNLAIFQHAASVLHEGRLVALVTVVSVAGSTPGKVGYKMLVFEGDEAWGAGGGEQEKGRSSSLISRPSDLAPCDSIPSPLVPAAPSLSGVKTVGTVGGGLIEARMIEEAAGMLGQPASRLLRFDLAGTPDDEKGICGGTIELLIEVFDKASLPLFQDLCGEGVPPLRLAGILPVKKEQGQDALATPEGRCASGGEDAVLVSIIAPDGLPRKLYLENVEGADAAGMGISQEVAAAIEEVATSQRAGAKISIGEMDVFIESLALQPTVVLFGAGHVSYDIARLAKTVHFRVVVCDDRAEYANRERFPDADEIVVEGAERVFDKVRIDDRSYIVIVTRGHKHDFAVLERAIRTDARYIGMIGSKRKTLTLLEKLREKGVPEPLLERVYSPIGISIGAVTAQEIALSIVCELVKIRRLGDGAPIGHMSLSQRGGGS